MSKEKRINRAGFVDGWRSLAASTHDLRDNGVALIGYNMLWLLVSLPLVTLPPATAALYVITHNIVYGHPVEWRDFFRVMRKYVFIGWRWGLLNLIAILLLALNVWFYGEVILFSETISAIMRALWVGLGVVWFTLQMYCFPVLLEQETPKVRLALRNAAVLVLRHPMFTLVLLLVSAVFLFMTLIVPYFLFIFTGALLTVFHARAVRYLWRVERDLPGIPEPDEPAYL